MELTDSDKPQYQLRNRTTTVSVAVRHKWRPCLMLICRPLLDVRPKVDRKKRRFTP